MAHVLIWGGFNYGNNIETILKFMWWVSGCMGDWIVYSNVRAFRKCSMFIGQRMYKLTHITHIHTNTKDGLALTVREQLPNTHP